MANSMSLQELEEKIASKIDPDASRELVVSAPGGGVVFTSVNQVMEFGRLMAVGGVSVPKHLRASPGACIAVCIQAIEWGLSPYAVANKSYSVNDRLSYEAQLIHAVILKRAPIRGRPKLEFLGEGQTRQCRVWATLAGRGSETVEYTSPLISKITPQNSPLWKSDPDQQLAYYSVRAWCRRHFPDAILGVVTRDEMMDSPREIAQEPPKSLAAKLDALAGQPPMPSVPASEPVTQEELDEVARQFPDEDVIDAPAPDEDDQSEDVIDPTHADYRRGYADANKGITKCLNRAIKSDPVRLAHWRAGYAAAHGDDEHAS